MIFKKNSYLFLIVLILFCFFCTEENSLTSKSDDLIEIDKSLKAFETAEGYGAYSKGGRGGKVVYVTNLNDDGVGSFREAVQASGPRTVVFAVSGVIKLKTLVIIENPYLTIAGQIAPGNGITLTNSGIYIRTHDVVIRYLRIRLGDSEIGHRYEDRDAITIGENAYNVIVDHVSASWAVDELISTFYEPQYITVQWSIFSEALSHSKHPEGEHSKAFLVGDGSKYVSVHKNVFAHNNDRSPVQVKGGAICDIINNVNYNWGEFAFSFFIDYIESGVTVNIMDNYFKKGPSSTGNFFTEPNKYFNSKIYVDNNSGDDSLLQVYNLNTQTFIDNKEYLLNTPINWESNVIIHDIEDFKDTILMNAGTILPKRDSIDKRIVQEIENGSGRIIDSQDDIGGYPIWEEIILTTEDLDSIDGDRDGMNDLWEISNGLNPDNPDDATGDINNDGYTNLEDYINSIEDSNK